MDMNQKKTELLNRLNERLTSEKARIALQPVFDCVIVMNDNMRTAAGRAFLKKNMIHLNKTMMEVNPEALEETLAHELAHLAAVAIFGSRFGGGHGHGWKNVMRSMGFAPDRCHNYEATAPRRSHKVCAFAKCGCRENIEIKTKKFKRIKEGVTYRCNRCLQRLVIKEGGA